MIRELEIWDLVQEKDETAFSDLYYSYVDKLYSYGLSLGYSPLDVEDAIHDLFVKIYLNRGKYTYVTNVKAYLFISLKNTLLNKLPQKEIIEFDTEKHESEEEGLEDLWIGQEQESERNQLVKRCLDQLTPRQQEVVYSRYFKSMSFKEIAEELNINIQSAKNIAQSAVKRMKTLLHILLIFLFY